MVNTFPPSSPCILIESTSKTDFSFKNHKSSRVTIDFVTIWNQGEVTMRLGTILAPFSGTLPPSVSCKLFAFLCLLAGLCSMHLPDALSSRKEEKILFVDSPSICNNS